MYRVFLSSTSVDLDPYRKAVLEAISKVDDFMPVAMENFGARDASAVDFDDRKVRQSDLFIGLLGHCYGSSPRGTPPSFTEREYDTAVDAGIPRLMFVAPEQFLVPAHLIEVDEQRQRQNVFRRRVNRDRVRDASFESPAELARTATAALANWHREKGIDVAPEILPTVDTRGFVGRGWYLFQLKRLLIGKERGAVAGLHGGPGFGKSALAAFFADCYRDEYPDGIVTVDRRQHPNAEAIAQHFAALISDPVDQDREGALRASEIMQTRFSRRRCLLILDNADQRGIKGLTITGRSALLITTRDREHLLSLGLSADACIGLKPLKPSEEGAMLANLIGRDRARAERREVQWLFRIVRGLPLALRIAAQTIATIQGPTPVHYNTSELWADLGRALSEEGVPLSEVRLAFERAIGDETNAWALSWYGLALSKEGLHDEAEALARQAVRKKPENSALLNNLALVLMAMREIRKVDEAIAVLEKAVELAPPGFDWSKKNLEAALRLRVDLSSTNS